MKKYEDRQVTRTETRCVSQTCDLCGKSATSPGMLWEGWREDVTNVNETEVTVTVTHKAGYNGPDCGSGVKYDIDLCPDCFRNKLVVWLKSQGAKIEEKSWDW